MSKHWPPDWTGIERHAPNNDSRSGVVPAVVSAVVIGLAVGGALSWTARNAGSGPAPSIEVARTSPTR